MPAAIKPLFRPEALRPSLSRFAAPPAATPPGPSSVTGPACSPRPRRTRSRKPSSSAISSPTSSASCSATPAPRLEPTATPSRAEARPGQRQVRRRRAGRFSTPRRKPVRRGRGGERAEGPARPPVRRPEGLGGRPGVRLRDQPPLQLDPGHEHPPDPPLLQGDDKQTYERFDTEALAADERQLKKFVFLLHAKRMVPRPGRATSTTCSRTRRRSAASSRREVYREYAFIAAEHALAAAVGEPRVDAPADLWPRRRSCSTASCSSPSARTGACCRPRRSSGPTAHRDPYNPRPLWENFRGMFRAINVGNEALDIRKYNGGLFADDPVLDGLKVPDEVFGLFHDLADYDFRPASAIPAEEVVSDKRLVDVEILGHIFEQSIDDLEKLHGRATKPVEIRPSPRPSRQGEAVEPASGGGLLHAGLHHALHRRAGAGRRAAGPVRGAPPRPRRARPTAAARKVLADPRAYDLDALKAPQRQALLAFWQDWQDDAGLDPDPRPGLRQRGVPDRGVRPAPRRVPADQRPGAGAAGLRRAVRPGPQDPPGEPLRRGPERRGRAHRQAEPVDQDGREGQGADEPRPHAPRRQQHRGRPGGRPAGVRLAGRVPRGRSTANRRLRRGDRQPAVHPAGVALADQAVPAIAIRGLPRHGRPVRLLLRAGPESAEAGRPAVVSS